MASPSAHAQQLIQLAQHEIYQCHLQRRSLDLHITSLDRLLQQVAEAFQLEPNLLDALPPVTESLHGRKDPPGFGSQSGVQADGDKRTGNKAPRRQKKSPRNPAGSAQPSSPVQILKAAARGPASAPVAAADNSAGSVTNGAPAIDAQPPARGAVRVSSVPWPSQRSPLQVLRSPEDITKYSASTDYSTLEVVLSLSCQPVSLLHRLYPHCYAGFG